MHRTGSDIECASTHHVAAPLRYKSDPDAYDYRQFKVRRTDVAGAWILLAFAIFAWLVAIW